MSWLSGETYRGHMIVVRYPPTLREAYECGLPMYKAKQLTEAIADDPDAPTHHWWVVLENMVEAQFATVH